MYSWSWHSFMFGVAEGRFSVVRARTYMSYVYTRKYCHPAHYPAISWYRYHELASDVRLWNGLPLFGVKRRRNDGI